VFLGQRLNAELEASCEFLDSDIAAPARRWNEAVGSSTASSIEIGHTLSRRFGHLTTWGSASRTIGALLSPAFRFWRPRRGRTLRCGGCVRASDGAAQDRTRIAPGDESRGPSQRLRAMRASKPNLSTSARAGDPWNLIGFCGHGGRRNRTISPGSATPWCHPLVPRPSHRPDVPGSARSGAGRESVSATALIAPSECR
jgi:hypothetical protein